MSANVILGGGITGLAAGIALKYPIFEAENYPGGICSSYYLRPNQENRLYFPPEDENAYRFEFGGGHWIFGADTELLKFIESFSKVKRYERKSSVYFPNMDIYVPYPIQNHLSYLPKHITDSIIEELNNESEKVISTLSDWLLANFGKTLCDLFFFPFHELYTAGLYKKIIPQDQFKSPIDKNLIMRGLKGDKTLVGYNAFFYYPANGLNELVHNMADKSEILFNQRAEEIDIKNKKIIYNNRTTIEYKKIYSTIPLNVMIALCQIELNMLADPYTSVLVLNIGAQRGVRCPDDHWIYLPQSYAGFHRVGFYSNVDTSFLPKNVRKNDSHISIYVERSFNSGYKISKEELEIYKMQVVKELQDWGFIKEVEVIDATWIEYAYTWTWVESTWRSEALIALKENNIYQIGRYGRWKFQGIAESIRDGLRARKYEDNLTL